MLLRCSRSAEHLDKLAWGALGRSLGQSAVDIGKATKAVGGFGKRHWKGLGMGAMVGAITVPMAISGAERAKQGLSDENYQARMAGHQEAGLPKARPQQFNPAYARARGYR